MRRKKKKIEIHKLSQLLITCILKEFKSCKPLLKIFQKSNHLTGTFWVVKTYIKNHIQKLKLSLSSTNLCVIQIIPLFLFGFWVIESQQSDCSCSHFLSYYKIFFLLLLAFNNTDSILRSSQCQLSRFPTENNQWDFWTTEQKKPPYFCPLQVIFK